MGAHVCVCIHASQHVCVHVCVCMHVCVCVGGMCMRACVHVCVYACVRMYDDLHLVSVISNHTKSQQ